MNRCILFLAFSLAALSLASSGAARAAEGSAPSDPAAAKAIEKAHKTLNNNLQKLQEEFQKLTEEKASDDELKGVVDRYRKLIADEAPKLFALAEKSPDSKAAYQVFEMAMMQGVQQAGKARELVEKHHLDKPYIVQFVQILGDGFDDSSIEVLERIREVNPDRKILAFSALGLGISHKRLIRTDEEKQSEHFEKAKSLFAEIEERYSDIEPRPGLKIAAVAADQASNLDMVLKLSVGKEIIDLEGEDTDGKTLKLSDYRGKVVLLDFWATWCGPCMKMVPHERDLVARMNDKPFALIGVNGDREYDDAYADVVAKERISWRSFKNSQGDDNPDIAGAWGHEAWPTLYLVDHKGIIRQFWVGVPKEEDLDREIDKLVEAAMADDAT